MGESIDGIGMNVGTGVELAQKLSNGGMLDPACQDHKVWFKERPL